MKKLVLFTFLLLASFMYSQNGKMFLKDSKAFLENENVYVYQPAKGVLVPENCKVQMVFKDGDQYYNKFSVLIKKENGYEFLFKLPVPTIKVLAAIVVKGNDIIDNNFRKGYAVYFNAETKAGLEQAKLEELNLADSYSKTVLRLDIAPQEIISKYEKMFADNPSLKKGNVYKDYLFVK